MATTKPVLTMHLQASAEVSSNRGGAYYVRNLLGCEPDLK